MNANNNNVNNGINGNDNINSYSEAMMLENENENRTSSAEMGRMSSAEMGRMSSTEPPMYSSQPNVLTDSGGSDIEASNAASTGGGTIGNDSNVPEADASQSKQEASLKPEARRYISFGSDGNDHVIVDRWNRSSEGDASLPLEEEEEDEVTLMDIGNGGDKEILGARGESVTSRSLSEQRSPRAVAWMTPPASAGKVRDSLAMQTSTSTNSTLSDARCTPSTDESSENVKATTPELPTMQQQQQQSEQQRRSRVPQPCVMLLDASGNTHEVVDLETVESIPGEFDRVGRLM